MDFRKKFVLMCLVWLLAVAARAQTCLLNQTDTLICAGTTVNFTVTSTSGTALSYVWDFGDGFTANTATPAHVYVLAGSYTPSVTVTFTGGATCTVNGKLIRVFAKPIAKFAITTADTMCFKNNNLCVLDQSSAGPSNAPLKKRIFQLSNGYIKVDETPPFVAAICYSDSIDEAGHLFSLVIEVTDTNNCVDRLQKVDSVLLLPKLKALSFVMDTPPSCYTKDVTLTNTSSMPFSEVKSFTWNFGDSTFNTGNWGTVVHTYSGPGLFTPRLSVVDQFGCAGTWKPDVYIRNTIPDSTIYLSQGTSFNTCYFENGFGFISMNPDAKTIWEIFDAGNNKVGEEKEDTFITNFLTCGVFKLRMNLYFPTCYIRIDTTINIYGPKTIIENKMVPTHRVLNASQCEVHDTVFFKTPVPYLSCSSGNGAKNHLWDFGDGFAPPCTTDTRNGINIGVNCNYSIDSMEVKHAYSPGAEACYLAKLIITDPVTGCSDRDSTYLALKAPDANPDLSASPPRKGLTFIGTECIGSMISFLLYETLPECGYEQAWINVDSACGADNFLLVDSVGIQKYDYTYSSTCSDDGWITVGLIIKNGTDKFGNPCYDTAWYHHFLRMFPINPGYTMEVEPSCFPYTVKVVPYDSIQYHIAKVRWNFRPYFSSVVDTITQLLGPSDSIIFSQQRQYNKKGIHSILSVFTDELGCQRIGVGSFALGYKIGVLPSKIVGCVGDSIQFSEYIRYYKYGLFDTLYAVDFWGDTSRAALNKEKVWWDLGDGNGFSQNTPNAIGRYTKPGKYTLRIAAQDSLGCLDTLVLPDFITITKPQANIAGLVSTYYCAPQIVAFNDSTLFVDSVGNLIVSDTDFVASWVWEFGDGTPLSNLKNPAHNYLKNGRFKAKLIITTLAGCSDSASAQIYLKGPQPTFVISDTLGCKPFSTTFINTTDSALKSWTWYFGDPNNQTLTMLADSNVDFTYQTSGVFDVRLLGTENIFNPNTGNTIICNSFFPDATTGLPERKVYVIETPPINVLVKDTVCLNEPLLFTANGDTLYNGYNWSFGDGGSFASTRPDTTAEHVYLTSGVFNIQLIPIHSQGYECVDTVRKDIVAVSVEAKFEIDSSLAPDYTFVNQSIAGVRFEWDFGKSSAGASNFSSSWNGAFSYTDTGTYIVCLTAYNTFDCWDSVCEPVRIYETRVIIPNVFTPDNNDDKNDAFDIDIVGETYYELKIYNRWGALVFEGDKDGIKNDGINWNGLNKNEGEPCPAGTYYFIFTYQLMTEGKPTTVHGTVTLIRDK
jgi:gliding motility-associated-like protein